MGGHLLNVILIDILFMCDLLIGEDVRSHAVLTQYPDFGGADVVRRKWYQSDHRTIHARSALTALPCRLFVIVASSDDLPGITKRALSSL
jgi:hypothetical protein